MSWVGVYELGDYELLEAEARERVMRTANGQSGQLRIAYMSSAAARFLPALLQQFSHRHPDVHIELFEMTAQQQLEAFARHEIDLGLSRPLPDPAPLGLHSLLLYQDRLIAVLPLSHRFAKRKRLSLEDLAPEDFILFERTQASGLFDGIISACDKAGFSPRLVRQPAQMQTLLSQVASGIGLAIAPACLRYLQSEGCVFIKLQPTLPPIPLELHNVKQPLRPTVAAFIEASRQMRTQITEQMEPRTWP